MKKYIIFFIVTLTANRAFTQGAQVTLQAPQYKTGIAYLTYYMGANLNVADSAAVSNTGMAIFKSNKKIG